MERIIIGTGRCGSTLLSTLLSHHPDVMVLSEFFRGLDPAQGWPSRRDVPAEEFIRILGREDGISPVYMAHDRNIGEVLIDVERERRKRPGYLAKPIITFIALRFLSEDPDALFDEIVALVGSYPPQPLRRHFLALFAWLQARFGKSLWIERSGLSTSIFRQIREVFPDGKFVHIHRDGMETALSMRNHLNMAVNASYHAQPPTEAELRETIDLGVPAERNPMLRRVEHPLPVEKYAEYWLHSLVMAYRELRHLRPEQWLEIRYEELVDSPRETLRRVAGFFALPPGGQWLDAAVEKVRKSPPRAARLPAEERRRLRAACWLGEVLTGRDEGVSPADIANGRLLALRQALPG